MRAAYPIHLHPRQIEALAATGLPLPAGVSAISFPLDDWRAKYFGHSSARVFIVGNRLRVFVPRG